jgi:hypothetical protein
MAAFVLPLAFDAFRPMARTLPHLCSFALGALPYLLQLGVQLIIQVVNFRLELRCLLRLQTGYLFFKSATSAFRAAICLATFFLPILVSP